MKIKDNRERKNKSLTFKDIKLGDVYQLEELLTNAWIEYKNRDYKEKTMIVILLIN